MRAHTTLPIWQIVRTPKREGESGSLNDLDYLDQLEALHDPFNNPLHYHCAGQPATHVLPQPIMINPIEDLETMTDNTTRTDEILTDADTITLDAKLKAAQNKLDAAAPDPVQTVALPEGATEGESEISDSADFDVLEIDTLYHQLIPLMQEKKKLEDEIKPLEEKAKAIYLKALAAGHLDPHKSLRPVTRRTWDFNEDVLVLLAEQHQPSVLKPSIDTKKLDTLEEMNMLAWAGEYLTRKETKSASWQPGTFKA